MANTMIVGDSDILELTLTASGGAGASASMASWPDKTAHLVSGAATLEGSNDNTNWVEIEAFAGDALVLIGVNPKWLRANGTGTIIVIGSGRH